MLISNSYTKTETNTLLRNKVDASNGVVSDSLTITGATDYPLNVNNASSNHSDWWMIANFRQDIDNAVCFIKFDRSGATNNWNMGAFNYNGFLLGWI